MKTTKGYSGPWNFYGVRYHNLLEFWGPWLQKLGSLLSPHTSLLPSWVAPLRPMFSLWDEWLRVTLSQQPSSPLLSSLCASCKPRPLSSLLFCFFFYVAKSMSDKVTCFVVTWVNKATVIFFVSRYQWHGTYKWDHCRPGVVRVLKQSRENSK